MKGKLFGLLIVLWALTMVGCSSTCKVRSYVCDAQLSDDIPEGVVFALPHTTLEVRITYSVYEEQTMAASGLGESEEAVTNDVEWMEKSTIGCGWICNAGHRKHLVWGNR